ncbi:hypothetical protein [Fusobacterium hominis]|uniref:Uncharacterized protein n=1 Tax=Fusobacterium hominis TaxID=2764326 RepID=A0A7G9GXF6_9FUSO|nr:hypothetical protein [Fusobacterium hominis]QNM15488.1 hypothetical protein H9Q81_01215 [Fusobacterium hominis]
MSNNLTRKENLMNKLKAKMEEAAWKSSFDFESFEIDEATKEFIVAREEIIANSFKKYASSKYEMCTALYEVKVKLQEKGESFMAWYQNLGLTKDKVSELLKTNELYLQAPQFKDYISSLSGLAVRMLTNKNINPQLALDVMEKGVKNTTEIKELLEDKTQDPAEEVKDNNILAGKKREKIAKKIVDSCLAKIDNQDLKAAKQDLNFFKNIIKELEDKIAAQEEDLSKKNNLKLVKNKLFIDGEGNIYFVRDGIGQDSYKVFKAKNYQDYKDNIRVHGVKSLPWRETEAEAYEDLVSYAQKKSFLPFFEIEG